MERAERTPTTPEALSDAPRPAKAAPRPQSYSDQSSRDRSVPKAAKTNDRGEYSALEASEDHVEARRGSRLLCGVHLALQGKVEAAMEARYLRDLLHKMLRRPSFLDSQRPDQPAAPVHTWAGEMRRARPARNEAGAHAPILPPRAVVRPACGHADRRARDQQAGLH
eukprot:4631737-Prymnesium_polylepis.1